MSSSRIPSLFFTFMMVGCAAKTGAVPDASLASTETAGAHAVPVRALAEPFVKGGWTPALAIGLVTPGGAEAYGFGRTLDDGTAPPNADTAFEIGSVTKVFTSVLLADAVRRGELTLEQPIDELLPEGVRAPSLGGERITLRELATHTSGLPSIPANFAPASDDDPYADYSRDRLLAFLPTGKLETVPGTAYAYSNFGVGLLGQLLSDRASSTYGELVSSRVLAPLGMTRTGVAFPSGAGGAASGHDVDGRPVPAWSFAALAGAGALRSTVADLTRFVQANLAPPDGDLGAALALTHGRQTTPPIRPLGLGWHIGLGDGALAEALWHNGETAGAHAFVALDLEGKNGVIVLASSSQMRVDELGIALLRTVRGEAVPPLALPHPTEAPAEATLESYVGVYRVSPDFALTITREGSRLYVQATDQPRFGLYPEAPGKFFLRAVDASISFSTGHLVLHQDGRDVPATLAP